MHRGLWELLLEALTIQIESKNILDIQKLLETSVIVGESPVCKF
jgi:hypothetical protein